MKSTHFRHGRHYCATTWNKLSVVVVLASLMTFVMLLIFCITAEATHTEASKPCDVCSAYECINHGHYRPYQLP